MLLLAIQAPQQWLYQVAQAFLFLSYATTNMLALRLFLALGCLFFLLWGGIVLDVSMDTIAWNFVFLAINLYQAGLILASMMPVKLNAELEAIYQHFFAPGKHFITRADFKALVKDTEAPKAAPRADAISQSADVEMQSRAGTSGAAPSESDFGLCAIRNYAKGEHVFDTREGSGNTLSLLLSGQCLVEQIRMPSAATSVESSWRPLQLIHRFEFLNSPEWATRTASRTQAGEVRARVTSSDGARVLVWNAAGLDKLLKTRAGIESSLYAVVNADLAHKVFTSQIDIDAIVNEDAYEGDDEEHGVGQNAGSRQPKLLPSPSASFDPIAVVDPTGIKAGIMSRESVLSPHHNTDYHLCT